METGKRRVGLLSMAGFGCAGLAIVVCAAAVLVIKSMPQRPATATDLLHSCGLLVAFIGVAVVTIAGATLSVIDLFVSKWRGRSRVWPGVALGLNLLPWAVCFAGSMLGWWV